MFGILVLFLVNAQKVKAIVARQNTSAIPLSLRDYASRLDQIHSSLSTLAIEAGKYNEIVGRMAASVGSTSTALWKALDAINSMEHKKEHAKNKPPRKVKAAGARQ